MSWDASTWAAAQVMPFDSPRKRQRAKAVLKSFGAYADVRGRAWVAMGVLLAETDLGCERTVQRGIADLRACGLLEETEDWEIYKGKRYPIYQLPLDRGPQNTRERLRAWAGPGVTPVSPQEGAGEVWGDTAVTPRGDTGDGLGVTPVSPKQERETLPSVEKETSARARAAASRLAELEAACPQAMLRFYDQRIALAAVEELLAEGVNVAVLPAALRRMAGHRDFRSRKHPPQLHTWLKARTFLGGLAEEGEASPAEVAAPVWAGPPGLRAALVKRAGGAAAVAGTLDRSGWDEARQVITPRTTFARDKLRDWLRGLAEGAGITVGEVGS